jgi:hypothetical protein
VVAAVVVREPRGASSRFESNAFFLTKRPGQYTKAIEKDAGAQCRGMHRCVARDSYRFTVRAPLNFQS